MDQQKLKALKQAGQAASKILRHFERNLKVGDNLLEIDRWIAQEISQASMEPAFKGFRGYPNASCLSVNSVVVHGIPYNYNLKEGDVLSIDIGVRHQGWIVDTATTVAVGQLPAQIKLLLATTKKALDIAIKHCQIGSKTGDIGNAIQNVVEKASFSVVRELTGHGVGKTLQESPSIPNFGKAGIGTTLQEGMILAIEPITLTKASPLQVLEDHWSIMATNQAVAAHFEHTVALTDRGTIILTA